MANKTLCWWTIILPKFVTEYNISLEKGKLGAYAMKRVATGAHLTTPWLFGPAKRPDDRADYCLGNVKHTLKNYTYKLLSKHEMKIISSTSRKSAKLLNPYAKWWYVEKLSEDQPSNLKRSSQIHSRCVENPVERHRPNLMNVHEQKSDQWTSRNRNWRRI